jgi:chaperone required for assembly of F1-ATPase
VLDEAHRAFGTLPRRIVGLIHEPQPAALLDSVKQRLTGLDNWQLTAAYLLTTLLGSAFIALGQLEGQIDAEAAWAAANVEEDYQSSLWGDDWEARIRREARHREFQGLVQFLALLR